MSDRPPQPGWWKASDGKWYPPRPDDQPPAPGWWLASDGKWYPPRPDDQPPAPGWWLASNGRWYPPDKKPGTGKATQAADDAIRTEAPAPTASTPAPTAPDPTVETPRPAAAAPVATPTSAPTAPAAASPTAGAPSSPADASSRPATKKVAVKKVVKKVAAKKAPAASAPAAKAPATKAPAAKAPVAPKPASTAKPAAKAPAGPVTKAGGGVVRRQDLDDLDLTDPAAGTAAGRSPEEQIAIRNRTSQQDAKLLSNARSAAASRALASLRSQIQAELATIPAPQMASPDEAPPPPVPPGMPAPAAKAAPTPAKAPATPPAAAAATSAKAPTPKAPTQGAKSPAAAGKGTGTTGPSTASTGAAGDAGPTIDRTPATTSQGETPLMEVKPSPMASDIDRIGERLVIFADRVELHERSGRVRQSISGDQIADVVVARRFTGHVVTVEAGDGTTLQAKGLRPEQAEEIRDLIMRRTRRTGPAPDRPDRPAGAPTPGAPAAAGARPASFDTKGLLAKLDDLHRAGVLTDAELAEKRAVVASLARGERLAPTAT